MTPVTQAVIETVAPAVQNSTSLPWSDNVAIAVNIAGVLGFLLSAYLAVREVLSLRVRISLMDAEYYLYTLPGAAYITIKLTINNLSSRAVSICSFKLIASDKTWYPSSLDSRQIYGYRPSNNGVPAQLRSDSMPIYLSGHQGSRLMLFFRCPPTAIQVLHLPSALPLSEAMKEVISIGDTPEIGQFRFEIQTGRKTVQKTLSATRKSMKDISDYIRSVSIFEK